MSAVEKLQAARDLVARPDGWTQGAYARVAQDGPILTFTSSTATCWCLTGALRKTRCGFEGWQAMAVALGILNNELFFVNWNDSAGRTQAEVVAAFDKAIELARAAS